MQGKFEGWRWFSAAALAVLCALTPGWPAAAEGPRGEGYGYIDTPAEGQIFVANATGNALVQCRSSGQGVGIRGAAPQQQFNVSWQMYLTLGATLLDEDFVAAAIVQCDGDGRWDRLARGTGTLSGQRLVPAPSSTTCSIASILTNNAGGQPSADYPHTHNFSVVAQQGGGGGGGN